MSLIFEGREGIKLRTVNSEGSRMLDIALDSTKNYSWYEVTLSI
jgi:hypothetical protein